MFSFLFIAIICKFMFNVLVVDHLSLMCSRRRIITSLAAFFSTLFIRMIVNIDLSY